MMPDIARRDTFTPPRSFGWATRTKATRKCRCSNGCRLRTAKHARARSSWDACGARHRCHARRATTATPSSFCDARCPRAARTGVAPRPRGGASRRRSGGRGHRATQYRGRTQRASRRPSSAREGVRRARPDRREREGAGHLRAPAPRVDQPRRAGFGETWRAHCAVPRGHGASGVGPTRDNTAASPDAPPQFTNVAAEAGIDVRHVNGASPNRHLSKS